MSFKKYTIIGERNIESNTIQTSSSTNNLDNFMQKNINNIFLNGDNKEKVLVVGQVQSGKTGNIVECIKYAIKNDYKLVVFIAGITNILLRQTIDRICKSISSDDAYFFDKTNVNNLESYINMGKISIVQILKEKKNIETVCDKLFDIDLSDKKVLIIDDECDYASLNTNIDVLSTIYKNISRLYDRFKKGKFLQFTGTPFANLTSSISSETAPDRLVTLENYNEYCGIHKFNEVSDNVFINLDLSKKSDGDPIKKGINNTILIWLLSTSLAWIEDEQFQSELLFNFDNINDIQLNFYKNIVTFLEIINGMVLSNEFKESIKKINNEFTKFEITNWNLVVKKIDSIVKTVLVHPHNTIVILNSQNEKSSSFDTSKYKFKIIIGGFMISRGFTFENLTTEFFFNSPSSKISIDTLLQRCRWFGNRQKRLKYMRIITNYKIKEALEYSQKYVDIFEKGTSTTDINNIKNKIIELDNQNNCVGSTSAIKKQ